MEVAVIGAHGQIGQLLLPRLVAAGHDVRAVIRDETQRDELDQEGVTCVVGDVEGDFERALSGADAVIFTAGSGGSTGAKKTLLVDLWGAVKTMKYCEDGGPARYVMISSRLAGEPDSGPDTIKHYLVAKHFADEYLKSTDLDWTILRPGRLLNEPGTGSVSTERPESDQQSITREDVADCIVQTLASPDSEGKVIELYAGDTAIDDAI